MKELYTIFIVFSTIQSIQTALPASQCMSLKGSRYCKEFGQFTVPKDPSPWLRSLYNQTDLVRPRFETVEDFDKLLDAELVNIASTFFNRGYGCTMNGRDRYETTILCGAYIQVSNGVNIPLENYRCGTSIAKVCSSTLTDWYDSLENAIKDPNICPLNETERAKALSTVAAGRISDANVDWLSGKPENKCIDGRVNEKARCGYSTDAMAKKMNCPSMLVSSESSNTGLGAGEIIGIVCAVIGAVLITGVSVMAYRKRRGMNTAKIHKSSADSEEENNSDNRSPTVMISPLSYKSQQKFHYPDLHVDIPPPSLPRTAADSSWPNSVSTDSTVFTAVEDFASPSNVDEVVIRKGDQVYIEEIFDDGWALGRNLTTGVTGMFPMTAFEGPTIINPSS
ncbi:hypothetical protein BKA69DRAFT_1045813 [Paraphysoderma sedebokerense]|nr:hypothetical protein BKA69DRAFT_1045813 [Paraphysoderma sedebokerense]